jgi:hypothetical protein
MENNDLLKKNTILYILSAILSFIQIQTAANTSRGVRKTFSSVHIGALKRTKKNLSLHINRIIKNA